MIARSAKPADVSEFVEIMRDSFEPRVLGCTIYGCLGIGRYIGCQLKLSAEVAPALYTVVEAGGEVVAGAEIIRQDRALLLGYIAVRSGRRGRGIGSLVLAAALKRALRDDDTELRLDVMADNHTARDWYLGLGFSPITSVAWWRLPVIVDEEAPPALVVGLPQADACHQAFGFSQLTLQVGDRSFAVGRLGDHLYRLTDAAAVADPGVRRALRLLAPDREVLAIGTEDGIGALAAKPPMLRMDRLVAPVRTVVNRLGEGRVTSPPVTS